MMSLFLSMTSSTTFYHFFYPKKLFLAFEVSKMGLTSVLAQLVSLKKVVIKRKICFYNFCVLLLEMYTFEVVQFFYCLVFIQLTQFFSGSRYLEDSCFWWSIFPLNYNNAYGHQNFHGGGMMQRAITHKYVWHLVCLVGSRDK